VALRLDPNRSSRHSRRPNQAIDLPFGGTGWGTHVLPAREGIALWLQKKRLATGASMYVEKLHFSAEAIFQF
jgi:hypothetical protein